VGPLVLEDADGAILSLPPILNAEGPGSVRPGDRSILLESTGQRPARVADGLGLLMLPFVAAGWTVTPVPVDRGSLEESGDDLVRSRPIHLTARQLAEVAGISLSASEVVEELSKARLPVRAVPGGWEVLAPPWRPDLLQAVDLIEDTILARGVRIEDGLVPPSPSRGRRRPETRFRESVGDLLLGAGYVPLHTPVLIPLDRNDRVGRTCALRLVNPVSEELGILRDSLLPSLLGALGHNVRHGYPQGLSEIGPVIVADAAYETGGRTRWHAGFVRAGEGAGFADVAARVDAVVRAFGALGVREPVEIPGIIPGRGAILRIAGETVAEMGELRPELLDAERIPVAVAYGEIDLSMLWPLVRAAETD
jgi:phenylalanyl-tRNA synthetase beta chain